jgi:phage tail-like protein
MAGTVRSDPVRNFKYQVQITKIMRSHGKAMLAKAGFMSVSGLGVTTEIIPYREGGFNTTVHKLPGQSDFPPVQFQRGVFDTGGAGHGSWAWFKELFFYQQGLGSGPVGNDFRTTVIIRVLDHPVTKGGPVSPTDNHPHGITKVAFKIHNAWPTTLQFSDLDAGGNAILVEQMTLVHEGVEPLFADAGKALPDNVFA